MQPPRGQSDIYLPTVVICVGGRLLEPSIANRVSRVSVTQRADPPDEFSIDFYDPRLTLIDVSRGRLTEGAEVEVSLGYSGRNRKLITGRIASLSADFPRDGAPILHVDGFDLLHDLARGTAYRVFAGTEPGSGQPDSEIVSVIAAEMSLGAAVRRTQQRRTPRVQNNISNLAFVEQLAAVNGYSLWAEGKTLHFQPSRPAPAGTIQLTWGQTLLSFTPRLSITGQVDTVEVRGWDPTQKQAFAARASGTGGIPLSATGRGAVRRGSAGRSVTVIADASVSSAQEAKALADQTLAELRRGVVTGDGVCAGRPDMQVGSRVELRGVGRFSGTYPVTEVTHTFSGGGYETSFQVNGAAGADDLFAVGAAPARGLAVGTLAGIVTANRDAGRRGRVRVRIPALGDRVELWARLSTLMAGPERGTFFLPEKGDEVLVAFEQGDVGRPFVVGSLWNGRDAQPDPNADDRNDLRLIQSRSGHKILLDDAKGAEKIEIVSNDGQHSIALDAKAKQVTVKSGGTIRLEGKKIEIVATDDLAIEVTGIPTTAPAPPPGSTTGITVKPKHLAISAQGTLTVKGSIVKIN